MTSIQPATILRRRDMLRLGLGAGVSLMTGQETHAAPATAAPSTRDKALIAITLDLEMAKNFPTWDQTHWNYHKGDLNDDAKRYAVEVARRVKAHGGRIHTFLVGQALEQENVDWLTEIIREGHFVGNHTYDHAYLLARKPEEIQFRFERAPWLIQGKSVPQVIRENIEMCTLAMKTRLGIAPAGFRSPGGFADGLRGRSDLQQMLLNMGFTWVSCMYPALPKCEVGKAPTKEMIDAILAAQTSAQPFAYPTDLIEVPMSPVSDVTAFREGRWALDAFIDMTRLAVDRAIERRGAFDFLSHPSVLGVMDPQCRTIEMICDRVARAGDRAAIVDLGTIAQRTKGPR